MNALHAEWTKLRTTPGTLALLLAIIATTIGVSIAAADAVVRAVDPAKTSLTGIQLGQAVVAILAVLTIGNEYSNGMVRTTLTAIPRRPALLAAKAIVLAAVVLAVALPAVAGSLLSGRAILSGLSLDDGAVWRAAIGSVLYLTLIALLSLGIGTAVRSSAAAIGIVLGLLYVFPIVALAASDPVWQRHLLQIGPTTAGLAIQATTGLSELPIGPWAGLGVLSLWAAGALLGGALLLQRRDA
jgi:ABC-2 type transport system permease protein